MLDYKNCDHVIITFQQMFAGTGRTRSADSCRSPRYMLCYMRREYTSQVAECLVENIKINAITFLNFHGSFVEEVCSLLMCTLIRLIRIFLHLFTISILHKHFLP